MWEFDDSRLDDLDLLVQHGDRLRSLAMTGASLRQAVDLADWDNLDRVAEAFRPRSVIALGPEARLIRAVVEPTCPVAVVAWPRPNLPAWVGPLDLVVVVGGEAEATEQSVREANRRGAVVFAITPQRQVLAEFVGDRSLAHVVTGASDPFVNATIALCGLEQLGLAPAVQPQLVADGLDRVAEACSPHQPLGQNPAKEMAVCLADTSPLLWGGTVLSARVARRLAESIRQVSQRLALAADATELRPVLSGAQRVDPFADPFLSPTVGSAYCLVTLDDAAADQRVDDQQRELEQLAESRGIRLARLRYDQGSPVERYAGLLQHGLFATAFLGLGLRPLV
ncbi:MAG: hypothetical protein LBL92_00365 [Propionibacteriaceae bacterium]|jgi:hypothetical protein|nr:hypothetical protein [Propionibacteriaceae bacterium]